MIMRVFSEISVISVIKAISLRIVSAIWTTRLIRQIPVMWAVSVTKVVLVMRVTWLIRAVIRKKRKAIHEGLTLQTHQKHVGYT